MRPLHEMDEAEITLSSRLVDALSNGPLLAEELFGPQSKLWGRVQNCNRWHAKHHSHWRVRGTCCVNPNTHEHTVRYELVME